MNEFVSSRVVIFDAVLLPKGLIRRQLFVYRRLHQAAGLHILLHEHVYFTVNFSRLQYRLWSGGPSSDFTIFAERSVLALLYRLARLGLRLASARRLGELFLNTGCRFGIHSFGIRLGMAGPGIAFDCRQRRKGWIGRDIAFLLI